MQYESLKVLKILEHAVEGWGLIRMSVYIYG